MYFFMHFCLSFLQLFYSRGANRMFIPVVPADDQIGGLPGSLLKTQHRLTGISQLQQCPQHGPHGRDKNNFQQRGYKNSVLNDAVTKRKDESRYDPLKK